MTDFEHRAKQLRQDQRNKKAAALRALRAADRPLAQSVRHWWDIRNKIDKSKLDRMLYGSCAVKITHVSPKTIYADKP